MEINLIEVIAMLGTLIVGIGIVAFALYILWD